MKYTLVQALRLCTSLTTHRRSRGVDLLFLDHGTRRGWRVIVTPRPLFKPGKDPVPIVQEAGWFPGLVWTGAENLAHTRIRSSDRPAPSQSLYRLRYPVHHKVSNNIKIDFENRFWRCGLSQNVAERRRRVNTVYDLRVRTVSSRLWH